MSQVIKAPEKQEPKYISVFLAGGITDCGDWHKEVIAELENEEITIYNPKRENFDVTDLTASCKQITWEYDHLEKMDIFSMYFCNSDSVQPICMYELGRNLVRMQNRFPSDWRKRIVISIERGYKRTEDVIAQVGLCCNGLYVDYEATTKKHAQRIRECAEQITVQESQRKEVDLIDRNEAINAFYRIETPGNPSFISAVLDMLKELPPVIEGEDFFRMDSGNEFLYSCPECGKEWNLPLLLAGQEC